MKLYVHIIYIEKVEWNKFFFNILTNKENWPIVCMAHIYDSGPIRIFPIQYTYTNTVYIYTLYKVWEVLLGALQTPGKN